MDNRRLKLWIHESTMPQQKMQKFSFSPDALLARDVSNRNVPCDYTPFPNVNIRPSTSTIMTSASFPLLENTLTA